MNWSRIRNVLTAVVAAAIVLGGAGAAWGYWTASSSGAGGAAADAFPSVKGTKPGVAVSGGTATLTFGQVTTNGVKQPASSYTINRFDATGTTLKASTTGTCSTASGTVTCTVGSVPDGQWTFDYLPQLGSWAGQDSNLSDAVYADSVAPAVSAAGIGPSSGLAVGSIHQGGSYYVYANASDATTGVASVSANVSTISNTSSAVALVATGGPWSVGGTSYSYRSAVQTANATLSEGSKSFTVTATDGAANSATASFSVTVDNTAPATPGKPALASGSDSGSSSTDNITNVNKPTFTGSADTGSTVHIYDNGNEVASGTAASGAYTITLTSPLSDGSHAITAKASDAADNFSSASAALTVTIDTVAPTAPTGTYNDGNNGQGDTITGTAEANTTLVAVETAGPNPNNSYTATAAGGGSFTLIVQNISPNKGTVSVTYSVTATDKAGNVSVATVISGSDKN